MRVLSAFLLLYPLLLNFPCPIVLFFSQELGRNFVDPIPLDVLPAMVNTRENLVGASVTSKFPITTVFPGVSSGVVDVYEEYVPRLVPRGPRSVTKRGRADGSSSGLPASKKSRQPSTHRYSSYRQRAPR